MKEFPDKELMQHDGTFFSALEEYRKKIKDGLVDKAMADFNKVMPATEWSASKSGWGLKSKIDQALVDPYTKPSMLHQGIYSTMGQTSFRHAAMNPYKDPNSHAGTLGNTYKQDIVPEAARVTLKSVAKEDIYSPSLVDK